MLSVSQIAKRYRLSRTAILYYEKCGLLKPALRTEANYRVYGAREAKRLEQICLYRSAGVSVRDGVFLWFSGPSFETPAEVKAARLLGADLIGVSLVPEAILARRFGVPFAGVAVVTDFGAGFSGGAPTGDFTRGPAVAGLMALKRLVRAYVKHR